MAWVLDASLALCWALPDESTRAARAFLAGLTPGEELLVPALWWYEVSNGLAAARRRGRMTEADLGRIIALFERLPLRTDPDLGPELVRRVADAAQASGLSAYDAAYLELARRSGSGLASLDRALASAARAVGIAIIAQPVPGTVRSERPHSGETRISRTIRIPGYPTDKEGLWSLIGWGRRAYLHGRGVSSTIRQAVRTRRETTPRRAAGIWCA